MNIVVINGTEKYGVTFKIKEIFLTSFRSKATITEFYLPKDCPNFCVGCTMCFTKGQAFCKDFEYIKEIETALLQADLIVFTSPAYVMHTTGAMKALLDHFGYRWMPHRPAKEMFSKRAVIIAQCLGAGAKSAAKDIKDSLSWWGISKIKVCTVKLMKDIIWEHLDDKKRKKIIKNIRRFSKKIGKMNYAKPARTRFLIKIKFLICRIIQKSISVKNPESIDYKYWEENGWMRNKRPWK